MFTVAATANMMDLILNGTEFNQVGCVGGTPNKKTIE